LIGQRQVLMNSANLISARRHGSGAALPWVFDRENLPPQAVRSAFRIFGIVVVRHALDREEVHRTRAALDRAFESQQLRDVPVMCPTEVLKHAAAWSTMFKERVVGALHAALGPELCYHQDLDVQRNNYGQIGWKRHTGWHMDSGSEGANAYLRAAGYRFAKCGIFLQDFDNGWGGGIRIKPKSHRGLAEPEGLRRRLFFARRALSRIASIAHLDFDTLHVPVRAGDFCFFDSRLLHSSVPPSWENIKRIGYDRTPGIQGFWRDIPPEHTKYVIYWDSSNAAMVADFLRNSIQRAEREQPGMTEQYSRPATFTRILAMRFPDDFPEAFVGAARERQIDVVSLSKRETDFYKDKLQTMQLIHP
jgi:Phytanoyl-CoA dioxygenase (PhyH)